MFLRRTNSYTLFWYLKFQDILKDAIENNVQSAAEIPYFEGDFWPNVLEESIKELDQEEEEKRKREEAEAAAAEEADLTTEIVEGPDVSVTEPEEPFRLKFRYCQLS